MKKEDCGKRENCTVISDLASHIHTYSAYQSAIKDACRHCRIGEISRPLIKTKIINHKRYRLLLRGISKAKAQDNARYIRRHGGLAEVLPNYGLGYDLWVKMA